MPRKKKSALQSETVTDIDGKDYSLLRDIKPKQRVGYVNTAKNPYLDNDLFQTVINAMNMTTYDKLIIFLSDELRPKEIEAAIAVKDFFNENGYPCYILMDERTANIKNFHPEFTKHFSYSIPGDPNTFIALAIGIENRADILCQTFYRKAILTLSVSCGREATSNFAAKHVNDSDLQCSTVMLYPMIRYLCDNNKKLKLSKHVKTEFLISMMYTLYGQRVIKTSTIDMIRLLTEDGADYNEAEYQINKITMQTMECVKRLTANLKVANGIATAMITTADLEGISCPKKELRRSMDKAVKMFRNLDNAYIWVIYMQEEEDSYYTILQTRRNTPYDMRRIAKKNNGIGTENYCRCLVYEMDLKKVYNDSYQYMLDTDSKLRGL